MRTPLGCVSLLCAPLPARLAKKNAPGFLIALQFAFFRPSWLVQALGTLPGRSGARFSRPKRRLLRRLLLRACTLPHNLPTLTKHCVGARISSFGLLAIVPTSSKYSLRTLLGKGFVLATRSTRAQKRPKRANMSLETANLAARTANLAAKTANLAAKTAHLGVPKPIRTRPKAFPSRPRTAQTAQKRFRIDFLSVWVDFRSFFSSIFRRFTVGGCASSRLTAFD